tara:strand:- start:345 stop:1082 length:738 start_codon:yes stop_codon:yes gene_type:complete
MKKEFKNIIILGGCGRIGSTIAKKLNSDGHQVYIIDNIKDKYLNKEKSIVCDISKINNLEKKIQLLIKKIKFVDVIINAAYLKNKSWGANFFKLKTRDVKENLFLQLGTNIMISQISINFFLKQGYGNLILFSSIQGVAAPKFAHYEGTKMNSPIEYSAVKAGIINITKYLAKLCKGKKIRVNCISPGGILDRQPKSFIKKYKKSCLSKGLLSSEDLNGIVEFLISDKSQYINGQNLIIDDGWTL